MNIKRISGKRGWGATTTIQALMAGYESMGINAIHVIPTSDLAWWNRSMFGRTPTTCNKFTQMLRSPDFKNVNVVLFDDYNMMPNTDGNPLKLLKWLEDSGRSTPKTVFIFSNED